MRSHSLNRSGLVAALALRINGMGADEAVELLRAERSPAVLCNPFFDWFARNALTQPWPTADEIPMWTGPED